VAGSTLAWSDDLPLPSVKVFSFRFAPLRSTLTDSAPARRAVWSAAQGVALTPPEQVGPAPFPLPSVKVFSRRFAPLRSTLTDSAPTGRSALFGFAPRRSVTSPTQASGKLARVANYVTPLIPR